MLPIPSATDTDQQSQRPLSPEPEFGLPKNEAHLPGPESVRH